MWFRIATADRDHSKHLMSYLKSGIDIYSSDHVFNSFKIGFYGHRAKRVEAKKKYKIGNFSIIPFDLKHDVPNFGYVIHHKEIGNLLFITDSYYCPYRFNKINTMLVECNYSQAILSQSVEAGKVPAFVKNRILSSHMELETTKKFLTSSDLANVQNIVLIHLSEGNANGNQFKKEVQELTGITTYIAVPNLEIDLIKDVF